MIKSIDTTKSVKKGVWKGIGRRSKRRKSNTKDEQINCDLCESVFTRKDNARRHLKVMHGKVPDFRCNECEFTTFTQGALSKHNAKHLSS